jgi:hypothetical protein
MLDAVVFQAVHVQLLILLLGHVTVHVGFVMIKVTLGQIFSEH